MGRTTEVSSRANILSHYLATGTAIALVYRRQAIGVRMAAVGARMERVSERVVA